MNQEPEEAAPPLLRIRGLCKDRQNGQGGTYSLGVPALDIAPGERILLTGPSGCGKSTLLDILGMALCPSAATSFFYCPGVSMPLVSPQVWDIAAIWEKKQQEILARLRCSIGYVLQTGGLLPFLSALENILLPQHLTGKKDVDFALYLAEKLGIRPLLGLLPARLSVGQRQRVAIARALAARPPLVLADEPTAALDPANAAAVLGLFAQMVDELGTTLILVSHAPEHATPGFRHLRIRQIPPQDTQTHSHAAVLEEVTLCA